MALIKDIYSRSFYTSFAATVKKIKPGFKPDGFVQQAMVPAFKNMEWKERMGHTTVVLHGFLSPVYAEAIAEIRAIITQLRAEGINGGLEYVFLADFISRYGLDEYRESVRALEFVTQFITCEFSIRVFLIRYPEKMYAQMLKWSKHRDADVRRLSTEGFRPRLPWAIAVPALKLDPAPILPVLENLKHDPSEMVRRSVANNLNDIAKDHPSIVLAIAKRWKGHSAATDAIIRHGSRTLLKQGHNEILDHFGLSPKNLSLDGFRIITPKVKTGKELEFHFTIHNNNKTPGSIRIEYAIWYLRANGSLGKKVFKVSEKTFAGGASATIIKRHSFRVITTKVYYPGTQELSVIINGLEMARDSFLLQA